MSGLASQIHFPRLGQAREARGASPGSLDQRSEEWPLCEGKCGALGVRLNPAPSEGGRELRARARRSVTSCGAFAAAAPVAPRDPTAARGEQRIVVHVTGAR